VNGSEKLHEVVSHVLTILNKEQNKICSKDNICSYNYVPLTCLIVQINIGYDNLFTRNYPDLQDPTNRNIVNCDEKLKTVLLGRSKVELSELPVLVKLHFPKVFKS
jgi:chromatin remodeling complex protein RSC6